VNFYDSEAMQVRLYLEGLCCDLCRFEHLAEGIPAEDVHIRQEVDLGMPGAFASASVSLPGGQNYFLEVVWADDREEMADRIAKSYGSKTCVSEKACKVRLVAADDSVECAALEAELRPRISPHLEVEVWTAPHLRQLILQHFGLESKRFEGEDLLALRSAVARLKGEFAYGESFSGSEAQLMLLWHLGCWTIRRLKQEHNLPVESMMQKGLYQDTAVLIADLSGFSSYVRDSPDDSVVQNALTSFYTKTRREVIDRGGMISQFVGDAVIAVFGVPVRFPNYLDRALECAVSIMDIGKSVSASWQSHIDRLQGVAGCHAGIALGDVHIVPQRPYSHSHMGLVADAVNMAARLSSAAQPGEIVLSNALYQRLGKTSRTHFVETDPIEAKNVGRLRAWRWKQVGPNSA
jgi:class 3 adenylate cyclase